MSIFYKKTKQPDPIQTSHALEEVQQEKEKVDRTFEVLFSLMKDTIIELQKENKNENTEPKPTGGDN